MASSKVVGVPVNFTQLSHPLLLAPVDVSLDGGLPGGDQPRVPQAEAAEAEETRRAHEGFIHHERSPCEHSDVLAVVLHVEVHAAVAPPVVVELFKEDFEAERHDEAAADNHEDHVEEEVSVVVMSNTVIEPGAMMVHFEDARIADTEIVSRHHENVATSVTVIYLQ